MCEDDAVTVSKKARFSNPLPLICDGKWSWSTDLTSASQSADRFPYFSSPREVGCFSVTSDDNLIDDASLLANYRPPSNSDAVGAGSVPFGKREWLSLSGEHWNLNEGYEKWNESALKCQDSSNLRAWLVGDDGSRAGLLRNADLVCWRGLLTKLLCTPYDATEEWCVALIRLPKSGTILMCELITEQRVQRNARRSVHELKCCYWGHRFEKTVTCTKSGDADTRGEYVSVVSAVLNAMCKSSDEHSNLRLLFAGEVDCALPQREQPKLARPEQKSSIYIELKTTRLTENERSWARFKARKWWAQSFLLGIPFILVGYRDDNGHVKCLREISTTDVERRSRDHWSASLCFNFLYHLLRQLVHVAQEQLLSAERVLVCSYRGSGDRKLHFSVHENDSPHYFLSEELYKKLARADDGLLSGKD